MVEARVVVVLGCVAARRERRRLSGCACQRTDKHGGLERDWLTMVPSVLRSLETSRVVQVAESEGWE